MDVTELSQNPNNLQISKNYKSGEVKIKQCYEQVLEPQSSRVQDFQEQLNKSNYKAYMGQPRARNNSQQFKRINLESKIETSQITRTTPKKPIFIQARQPNIQQDNLDLMR